MINHALEIGSRLRLMPRTGAARLAVAGLCLLAAAGQASAVPAGEIAALDRDRAQAIVANLRRITSDRGVEELKAVRIGGIEQWISVRGRDRDNPILLFIHGGPATPEMSGSWFYQTPWEDFFTVVQWDQRGAGKTMMSSTPEALARDLSVERFVTDGEELVDYLRKTYGKRKIFVLGHSWGTVIGLRLAERHPDWLHAYIGMGQAIEYSENERLGTEFAIDQAKARGNARATQELRAIAPYPDPGRPLSIEKIMTQRKWLTHFGGMAWHRPDLSFQEDAALLSPDYSDRDLRAKEFAGITARAVLPELTKLSFTSIRQIQCPVFILAGEHDYATSSVVAARWFARLQAPGKRLIRFAGVAHEIQFEAPGKLLFRLVKDVRPLAVRVGDGLPAD